MLMKSIMYIAVKAIIHEMLTKDPDADSCSRRAHSSVAKRICVAAAAAQGRRHLDCGGVRIEIESMRLKRYKRKKNCK